MSLKPNYLEERICLNVLANSVENAQACYEAKRRACCVRRPFKKL
ncbi:hypothetical protein EfsSVR2281_14400 [Enterococcus faecalis]|nr:hypothetical protein EfsSVR2281_14400 [Enterococcus faecalis]